MSSRRHFFQRANNFDVDYQTILDYADSQAYSLPSNDVQILQNQLVIDLKSYGIWSKLDLLYIVVNDSGLDFCGINWINTSNFYTDFSAWIFTSNTGIEQNTTVPSTNFTPSTDAVNYQLNDCSWFYKLGAQGGSSLAASDFVIEANDGSYFIRNTIGTLIRVRTNHTTEWTFARSTYDPSSANAFTVFTLLSNTNSVYANGSYVTGATKAPNSLPASGLKFGTSSGGYSNVHELMGLGASLNATEVSNFYTAFQDYLNAIALL